MHRQLDHYIVSKIFFSKCHWHSSAILRGREESISHQNLPVARVALFLTHQLNVAVVFDSGSTSEQPPLRLAFLRVQIPPLVGSSAEREISKSNSISELLKIRFKPSKIQNSNFNI